ncbi:MAG: hypothetical protein JWM96_1311, partial [Alphaproteobacteria bacterium]|nr:hypothetical protein [Alphaproteobacteria bacterium]
MSSLLGSVSGVLLLAGSAYAGPDGGVVNAGSAGIAGQGSAGVVVTQSSDRVVIDWNNFDTKSNEAVQFNQPGSGSIALNRITSGSPTQFEGSLKANGNVVLVNPNGVVFGAGSHVDVNGLIATTADIGNDRFMEDAKPVFDKSGNPGAKIVNNGQLTAKEAGLVGFVAPNVVNNGTIEANLGKVHLASGDSFTLDLYGDGLVAVKASDAIQTQLGQNSGIIHTSGGKIQITAAEAKNSVDALVLNNGILNASSATQSGGTIILGGSGPKARIVASGTIRAAGTLGGTIHVLGKTVEVKQVNIDASGTTQGGMIRIGGGKQGGENIARANMTSVDSASTIKADATHNGNGGSVVVWSDEYTEYNGHISAKGGTEGGNGGFAETSGKNTLSVTGSVDTSAADRSAGTWLLDPTNITLYNRSQPGTDNVNTFTTSYLETQSASTNISLVADTNLTLDLTGDTLTLANNRNISLTATNGYITSNSAGTITASGTGGITLTAGSNISFG